MKPAAPLWLVPGPVLDDWPVRDVTDPETRSTVGVPLHWTAPVSARVGAQCTSGFRGAVSGEGLAITLLVGAVASNDITGWLTAPMAVTGGVDPQLLTWPGTCTVLEWSAVPADGVADRLEADTAVAYTGLVTFIAGGDTAAPAHEPAVDAWSELIRIYALLVRRGEHAWKIGLALSSAMLPGSSSAEIDDNDHVRAQAVFGPLQLR